MRKKYINDKNDKNIAWFNIDNYQYIEDITESRLIVEFDIRKAILLDDISGVDPAWGFSLNIAIGVTKADLVRAFINRIFAGEPCFYFYTSELNIIEDRAKECMRDLFDEKANGPISSLLDDISDSEPGVFDKIWPTSIDEVINSYERLESMNLIEGEPENIEDIFLEFSKKNFDSSETNLVAMEEIISRQIKSNKAQYESVLSSFSKATKSKDMLCSIDLAGFNDIELVTQFQKSLVEWRELLNVPEPEKRVSTPTTLGKLKEFRIIPLLDLMIWESKNNARIKKSTLAFLLFPCNEFCEDDLASSKGKIKQFRKKVMSSNFDFKGK